MRNRNRLDSYKAEGDCYILKLDKPIFLQIMDEFEDIRKEVQEIVLVRERKRLEEEQK